MENVTAQYISRAEIWLFISTLLYFLMNGAQIFETLVFVPKWTTSVPENFKLLQEGNGFGIKTFWIIMHSIHEMTFILAIIFCWKLDPIRNWLIFLFIAHFIVRIWTLAYFAPNIIEFQKITQMPNHINDLIKKVHLWKSLNYIRVTIYIIISIAIIPLIFKLVNYRSHI